MSRNLQKGFVSIVLIALLLSALPLGAQAYYVHPSVCLHRCEREARVTDLGCEQYNKEQHSITKNHQEICSACGTVMGNNHIQSYENHQYNGSNYCVKCNHYKGCPHSNKRIEKDNRKMAPYNDIYHETSGTIEYYCSDCRKTFEQNTQGGKEQHSFVGGKCHCGFSMILSATPSPTKIVCPHTKTSEEIVNSSVKQHNEVTHTVTDVIRTRCTACDEVLSTTERQREDPHALTEGVCQLCKGKFGCTHPEVSTETVCLGTKVNQDDTHTLQRVVTTTCANCKLALSTETVPVTQRHTYVDGVCYLCGAPVQKQKSFTDVNALFFSETTTNITIIEQNVFLNLFSITQADMNAMLFLIQMEGAPRPSAPARITPREDAPDFGVLLPGLDHPYGQGDIYVMRVGDQAEVFVKLFSPEATDAETEAEIDAEADPEIDAESSATTEGEISLSDIDLDTANITRLAAENFTWDVDEGLALENSTLEALSPGAWTLTLQKESAEGFTVGSDSLKVYVLDRDDPYTLFVDEAFAQSSLPLLSDGETETLLAGFENIYCNAKDSTLCIALAEQLPLALGASITLSTEPDNPKFTTLAAPLDAAVSLELFGADARPIRELENRVYAWQEEAATGQTRSALPITDAEFFKVTLPWESPIALSQNLADLLLCAFTATPACREAMEPLNLAAADIADRAELTEMLHDALCEKYTPDQLVAEDSPVKALFEKMATSDVALSIAEAIRDPGAMGQIAVVTSAKTAGTQFALLCEELSALGIDAPQMLQRCAVPGAETVFDSASHVLTEGTISDPQELSAILTCIDVSRAIVNTWGQAPLVQGYISTAVSGVNNGN